MNHQLNPIYTPQGVSIIHLMEYKLPPIEVRTAKNKSNGTEGLRIRNSAQTIAARERYLRALSRKWQDRNQIADKCGAHPTSVNQIMRKDYMKLMLESRTVTTGKRTTTQWRLTKEYAALGAPIG